MSANTRRVVLLFIVAVALSACLPTSWSAEKHAAAVDACQRARSVNARIPNPSAGNQSLDNRQITYILDALEYLMDENLLGRFGLPPLRPFVGFSVTEPDWTRPTPEVIIERQDAIRVSLIRSGDRRLKQANESGIAQLLTECRRRNFIP